MSSKANRKAIFLEKDATLIKDNPLNTNPQYIKFLPGVARGLQILSSFDFMFVIITNQPGISPGIISEINIQRTEKAISSLFNEWGIILHGFYYCPHHQNGKRCECRKPGTKLFHNAAEDLNINLTRSWTIGDILDDVEAGHRAGCRSILINNGNETEWNISDVRFPDYIVLHMEEAAKKIISKEGTNGDDFFDKF